MKPNSTLRADTEPISTPEDLLLLKSWYGGWSRLADKFGMCDDTLKRAALRGSASQRVATHINESIQSSRETLRMAWHTDRWTGGFGMIVRGAREKSVMHADLLWNDFQQRFASDDVLKSAQFCTHAQIISLDGMASSGILRHLLHHESGVHIDLLLCDPHKIPSPKSAAMYADVRARIECFVHNVHDILDLRHVNEASSFRIGMCIGVAESHRGACFGARNEDGTAWEMVALGTAGGHSQLPPWLRGHPSFPPGRRLQGELNVSVYLKGHSSFQDRLTRFQRRFDLFAASATRSLVWNRKSGFTIEGQGKSTANAFWEGKPLERPTADNHSS